MFSKKHSAAAIAAFLIASCAAPFERFSLNEPREGERWTYQKLNAYNGNSKGETSYRVAGAGKDAVELALSGVSEPKTYPLHWGQFELVDGREFIYPLPSDGKETVNAFSADAKLSLPVTVYSSVSGREKIKVPAGEFDALKISRNIYVDDREWYKSQTRVRQFEWYAPAIAIPVKVESQASYRDLRRSRHDALIEGEWNRWVLTDYSQAPR